MEQERAHDQKVASAGGANMRLRVFGELGETVGRDAAESMGAGEDAQGSVLGGAVIEMESEGEHLIEQRGGWLNVDDAFFDRPAGEARDFSSFLDADAEVLMPGDAPVGVLVFVEKEAANGEGGGPEELEEEGSGAG